MWISLWFSFEWGRRLLILYTLQLPLYCTDWETEDLDGEDSIWQVGVLCIENKFTKEHTCNSHTHITRIQAYYCRPSCSWPVLWKSLESFSLGKWKFASLQQQGRHSIRGSLTVFFFLNSILWVSQQKEVIHLLLFHTLHNVFKHAHIPTFLSNCNIF